MKSAEPVFGWKKDKFDKRDYLHKPRLAAFEIPNHVDLTELLPEVRNQGAVGSCVGFGIGANLVAHAKRLGVYTEWFSPTWIYNGARFLEGTLSEDAGCWPRDALKWLRDKGCLLEQFWPYNALFLDMTSPPSHLELEASKYPLLDYYRVTGGVDGICSALAEGFYVSIGTPWFQKWQHPKSDGKLVEVSTSDPVSGGHETCLYGYDKSLARFFGINSWGKTWGNSGLFTIPFQAFSVFNKVGGYDAHYLNVNWSDVPGPSPPEPKSDLQLRCQFTFDGGQNWITLIELALDNPL